MNFLKSYSLFFSLFLSLSLYAQNTVSSGDWSNSSVWDSPSVPSSTITSGKTIVIGAGDTIILDSKLTVRSGAILHVYGVLEVVSSLGVEFFNGSEIYVGSSGVLKTTSGSAKNNSDNFIVDGAFVCTGDYEAGAGSVMEGDGDVQVQGTLTATGGATIMGQTGGCSGCNLNSSGVVNSGIYVEDFSNDTGAGWTEGVNTTASDGNWSLSIVGSPDLSTANNYAKSRDGIFEWLNLSGDSNNKVDWLSKPILGDYKNVSISFDYFVYSQSCDASLSFYYRLDGGSWVLISDVSDSGSAALLSGSINVENLSFSTSVELKVSGYTGGCLDSYCVIDNVVVNGIERVYIATWTGLVDSDFNNPSNWSINSVPVDSMTIVIPQTPNQPVINQDYTFEKLTVNASGLLNVGSGNFTVNQDFSLKGGVELNGGSIQVNGDATIDDLTASIDFLNPSSVLEFKGSVNSLNVYDGLSGSIKYSGANQDVVSSDYYNLIVSNVGTKSVVSNLTINGDLTVGTSPGTDSGCVFDFNQFELTIAGNITELVDDGLDFTDINSSVVFSGNTVQYVSLMDRVVLYDFANVTVSKGMNDIILNSDLTVGNQLTLDNGIVNSNGSSFSFLPNATVINASDASHINGKISKTTESTSMFTFPSGDGLLYNPISITPNSINSTLWDLEYFNTGYSSQTFSLNSDLDSVSSDEYWELDRVSGSADAIVELYWNSTDNITNPSSLVVAHFDGVNWEMIPSSVDGTSQSGVLRSTGPVSSFSPFTFGQSAGANPLPVKLTNFYGVNQNSTNNLLWEVESEDEYFYAYVLERSINGFDFQPVFTQYPSLNFVNEKYSFLDRLFDNGVNYYRLKLLDMDGTISFSKIISIDNTLDSSENIHFYNILGQESDVNSNNQLIITIDQNGSVSKRVNVGF